MSSLPREDLNFQQGGTYTFKQMPNGEERRRLVTPYGSRMIETKAPHWDPLADVFPWQDAHLHKGLTEHYIINTGWVDFLFLEGDQSAWQILSAGQHIVFPPLVPHVVLMGPDAVMVTVTQGNPVGNPDRNNEDWWPFDDPILTTARLRHEAERF
jgi:hypothetical protein